MDLKWANFNSVEIGRDSLHLGQRRESEHCFRSFVLVVDSWSGFVGSWSAGLCTGREVRKGMTKKYWLKRCFSPIPSQFLLTCSIDSAIIFALRHHRLLLQNQFSNTNVMKDYNTFQILIIPLSQIPQISHRKIPQKCLPALLSFSSKSSIAKAHRNAIILSTSALLQ